MAREKKSLNASVSQAIKGTFDLEKFNVKEKIVNKIEFVSKNKKLKKRIINNAFNYSLNFSWSRNKKKILNACL